MADKSTVTTGSSGEKEVRSFAGAGELAPTSTPTPSSGSSHESAGKQGTPAADGEK